MFSFALPFYTFHFMAHYSVQTTFVVYSIVELACFIPMVVLIWKGAAWRDDYGGPDWNLDM
jgi:hypothetical protein